MSGIAIPEMGMISTRRDLGSLAPHPANIGKIAGAKTGIAAPRMHFAKGGVTNAEDISKNMFSPIDPTADVPNADVSFIVSPQLAIGSGPPKGQEAKLQQQPSPMSQVAQGTQAANGISSLFGGSSKSGSSPGSSPGSISSLWNGSSPTPTGSMTGEPSGMGGFSSWFSGPSSSADMASSDAAASASSDAAFTSYLNSLSFAQGGAAGYANGGGVNDTLHVSGLLNSAGPGRTDTINTNVPAGAYVIPADVVSGIGEGNSLAGSAVIDRMFHTAPHGVIPPQIRRGSGAPKPPSSAYANNYLEPQGVDISAINNAGKYAKGGHIGEKAPVVVAGGEFVLSPQQIINKFGSLKKGHRVLDHWTVLERRRIAKEMLALKNPVGSKVKI